MSFFDHLIQSPPIVIALIIVIIVIALPSWIALQVIKRIPKNGVGNGSYALINRIMDMTHEQNKQLDVIVKDYTTLKDCHERTSERLDKIEQTLKLLLVKDSPSVDAE